MANCHKQFSEFDGKIALSKGKRDELRNSRRSNEEWIESDFKTNKRAMPTFHEQGSLPIATTVNPENKEDEYDLDDGVILQNLDKDSMDDWPATEKAHQWIVDALTNKTKVPPQDKKNCVRIIYARDYHVDFPTYAPLKDEYRLARKGEDQWVPTAGPGEYTEWFRKQVKSKGEQLKRVVRYLKAWNDTQKHGYKGVLLTAMAAKHFSSSKNRDDKAIVTTVRNAIQSLREGGSLRMPVIPKDDLIGDWDTTHRDSLKNDLTELMETGNDALQADSLPEATERWSRMLGNRFPRVRDDDDGDDGDKGPGGKESLGLGFVGRPGRADRSGGHFA